MTNGETNSGSNYIPNQPVEPVLKPLDTDEPKLHASVVPIVLVSAVILGIFSGIFFAGRSNAGTLMNSSGTETNTSAGGKTVVGSTDTKTFKDCAKGELAKNDGKITEEGTHILVRPGGDSQNVYLTSSVVDLDGFLKKEVEVCGQTNQGQKAGWLMDVGRVIPHLR